ncbi:hypothetical protein AALP_AA8G116100 [Arabis alpina]|uniref:FBD domain-containing protein n=1 Tax=Arabis alpina TaxID=50452 RepID=A0A087G6E3_ARAAL|nr:hypothetical protein AALP_AA8G116100 [Arabis alpina]
MIISSHTLEVLYRYSKLEFIPKFYYLYHLEAAFSNYSLQFFPAFLESCPNLKSLILDGFFSVPCDLTSGKVPRCLTSTLEYVTIKNLQSFEEETGINLVNYFLENSVVLEKLNLSYYPKPSSDLESIMKRFTSIELSGCQVFID